MAMTYYIRIDGVAGDSTSKGHEGWFDLSSFSFGESDPATVLSDLGSGKVSFSDLSVLFQDNTALAALLADSSSGKVIHSLEIEGVTTAPSGVSQTVYDLTLNDVLVSSVQQSAAEGGSPATSASFEFGQIGLATTSLRADGTLGAKQWFGWDLTTNTAITPSSLEVPNSTVVAPAGNPVDYFIHIDGIAGDSTSKGHEGWFELPTFSFGDSNPASFFSALASGKVTFSDLNVILTDNTALTALLADMAYGKVIHSVEIEGVTSGTTTAPQTVYDLTLNDVLVNSVQQSGSQSYTPDTSVSFDFGQIGLVTTSINRDGSLGTKESFGWDLTTNSAISPASLDVPTSSTVAAAAGHPVEYFIRIDGIAGDSTSKGHEGWFELPTFSFGGSDPATVLSDLGSGKISFSELSVMLNGNTALAALLADSSSGKVIHSLEIEGVTSGATTAPQTVYDLTLNNVLVSSVQQSAAAEGGSPATSASFEFGQIGLATTSLRADGTLGAKQWFGWDLTTNTAITPSSLEVPNSTVVAPAGNPVDYFIKIDGITGTSTSKGHEGWFELPAFSFGDSNPADILHGGLGAGKVSFSDLSVFLSGDGALTALLADSSSGKVIHSLEIEGVTSGTTSAPQTVYDLTLNDVLVSSVSMGAAAGGVPGVSASFDFGEIGLITTSINRDGSLGAHQSFGWDLITNSPINPTSLDEPGGGTVADTTHPTISIGSEILASDTGSSATDFITHDGHGTISGTASDNVAVAGVEIFDGTTAIGAATLSGSSWSFDFALSDGAHTLHAVATDTSGNTGSATSTTTVTVDTAAPDAPLGLADAAIAGGFVNAANDTAAQALTGTAEAGATVSVYDGTALLGTVTAGSDGAWSYALGTLADGSHSLTATATDVAGNTGAASSALAFIVDTAAPGVPEQLSDSSVTIANVVNLAHDTADQSLTGSAEPGSTVTVYDGQTELGTAPVGQDGSWSYTLGTLSDGAHPLIVYATDAAGNTGDSTMLSIIVDATPPDAPLGLSDAAIAGGFVNGANDTAAQVLTGTAESGATISVYDGDTLLGTVTAAGDGSWSYGLGVLRDGNHSLTATATDVAGNTGAASSPLAFTVDTAAPDAPAVALASDTGSSGSDGITSNGALNVTAAETGGTLGYSVDGGDYGASYDAASLADGQHTIAVEQTDAAGNVSDAGSVTFTLDRAAPDAPGVTLASDTGSNNSDGITSNGAVNVAPTESGGTLSYSVDGGGYGSSYDAASLADGQHIVSVEQTDAAGNVSGAGSVTFTLDTAAPDAPLGLADAAIVGGYVNAANDTAAQTLTGTAEAGATVSVYDGDMLLGAVSAADDGSWSYALGTLANGGHSLSASATDAAGNLGTASSALAFTVDTVAPDAPGVTLASDTGASNSDGVTSNGAVNVAAAESGGTLTYSVDGGAYGSSYDAASLADGQHTIAVEQTDAAGNVSTAGSVTFTLDTAAPDAPLSLADAAIAGGFVNAASDTAAQVLTGTAESGATISVYDGDTLLGTVTAAGDGSWSYGLGVLGDGSHSLTATATDVAGNSGAESSALAFTVDTAAPDAPAVALASDTGSSGSDGITSNGALNVTAAETGGTLGYSVDGGDYGASYDAAALVDGQHTVSVEQTDAAGNVSTAGSVTFTLDTAAPDAPLSLADAAIVGGYVNAANDTAAQTVTGSAEAGATVSIFDGDTLLGTATAGTDGVWSYGLGTLADGNHSLTATATDAAGNAGTRSSALAFTVDTAPPAAPASLADAAIVNGYVNAANDTSAQTLTGISEADATINVYDGSAFLGTVTADDTGAWSYGLGVLGDGSHSLTATATDAAGNTSAASDATAFTVDTVPPSPILVSVATSGSGLTLAGTSEAGSTVNVYDGATLVGSAVATADGTWSLSASQLSSSVHDFSLQATDLAGNTGTYSGENLVDGGKNGSLVGGSGDDFLWGGPGNGNLSGGAGDDRLDGGSGNDSLNGGTGNDRLVGGTGNDTLTGGSGSDVFVFDRGFGHDVVTDFTPGTDHLELSRDLFGAGWTDAQIYSYIVDHALRHGHDLILNIDGSDNITLSNISLTSLHSSDFIFT